MASKGAGSENMSEIKMLKPSDGIDGVKDFVVERVKRSGGMPCPPIIVGVGIGGNFEKCAYLAKKALLRPLNTRNPNAKWNAIENELLTRINRLGIGPMGLGGKTTVLDVHVEIAHRHPASLPVGIAVQCWADRRARMVIHNDWSWEVE